MVRTRNNCLRTSLRVDAGAFGAVVLVTVFGCDVERALPATDTITTSTDLLSILDLSQEASPDLWPPPPDLAVMAPRRVFVTSAFYHGNLGGLAGADAKCQAHAMAAGLNGFFKAWLSDSIGNTPGSRLTHSPGPYVLVTGVVIADSWITLTTGTLHHAINTTELGITATGTTMGCLDTGVWTDSREDGTLFSASETCGDWTNDTDVASSWGDWTSTDHWSSVCNGGNSTGLGCGFLNALYCFEQ